MSFREFLKESRLNEGKEIFATQLSGNEKTITKVMDALKKTDKVSEVNIDRGYHKSLLTLRVIFHKSTGREKAFNFISDVSKSINGPGFTVDGL